MTEAEGAFVQALLNVAVPILATALVGVLVALAQQALAWMRGKVGETRWQAIEDAVRTAVLAAEQTGLREQWQKKGAEKRRIAVDLARRILADQGIKLDPEQLLSLIEKAVYVELTTGWMSPSKTTEPSA